MTSILTDFISIFQKHHVEVILIGGWAAILHGSARSTIDVDFDDGKILTIMQLTIMQ